MSTKNILVESGEFSDGARFFSRPALKSGWFIMTIISLVGFVAPFYLYVILAHWNQMPAAFLVWISFLLFSGVIGTLVQSWRMHGRIHEMFLANAVKLESGSNLERVLDVAARTIQIWISSMCFVLSFSIFPLWWALQRAGILRH
jgi:hypothetical protein